ncbi:YdbL family protein [Asticcacaulis solisilvae]|uniref:YdbL family protein n=1 Tax=Asticcacaulis solisilvae TaxID=1217274 RepID=UPI003FD761FA
MKTLSVMKIALTALMIAGSGVAATALIATPASADVATSKALVDAAKAKGTVGEQSDGFLGFVHGAGDAGLKAAVDEINAGRREVYGQAAAKNGVSVDAAGQSAFTNVIFPKLSAGQYYRDASGAWKQK